MKVGVVLAAQDSDEYLRPDLGYRSHPLSAQYFRDELKVGELAAAVGFDSIWCVEHHSTAHGLSPAPLQQLAYLAGKTGVSLGTAVVVLPWNDPVRVVEQIAVLDNMMAPGATLTIGVGRGSAQVEFDAFQVPLAESNERLREYWEIVRLLLTQEDVTYEGRWRSFEHLTVLPRPRSADLVDRAVYSWGSRSSMEYAAAEGFLPLFVPQGDAARQAADMSDYNKIRAEKGWLPTHPIPALNVFVDEDGNRARMKGRTYLRRFYSNTLDHYQRLEPKHFEEAGNYSETAAKAAAMAKRDRDELLDELAGIQICGTPSEVLDQLAAWRDIVQPAQFIFVPRFGGMPYDEAERNVRLAATLLPEIEKW